MKLINIFKRKVVYQSWDKFSQNEEARERFDWMQHVFKQNVKRSC